MRIAITVVIIVVVLALLALVVMLVLRKRRSTKLQDRFGPEYDRNVARTGNRRDAERQLGELAEQRDRLEIRPLTPAARDRYQSDWEGIQGRFVDEPSTAVSEASVLVDAVMRDRGYPVEDFDIKESLVAADHPGVAEDYRAARDIQRRADADGVERSTTEELRTALVHYRALFGELLEGSSDATDSVSEKGAHSDGQRSHEDAEGFPPRG